MSTAVMTNRLELNSVADGALRAATRFWFAVTILGQVIFAFTVASFYALTALRGDYHKWNFTNGYVPGLSIGNTAVVMHVASAAFIMLAGAVQLVPQIRNRFPVFHRWNGRIYMLTAVTLSLAGLYMTWIRGSVGDLSVHVGSTLNAVLIWLCGGMALRYALARDFKTHRRWALRFFLVVSASWFFRIGFFLSLLVNKGPFGFDPTTFRGPFLTFMTFAQYLVPLAVLEIWAPQVKAAYDQRKSIAETLSATIASSGIEAAEKQYHDLKAARFATYNFDESELNNLGYDLIRAKKVKDGIRIFQLNVEAYPQSGNVYDSLGEAYMDDGNKPLAIANYQKSLQLNPKNGGAVVMLRKLNAP